jgi:F-type H+-transporting ATPase subunit epsilon|tara:strand:- start:570 stop:968 length:399 start_codon:yes stop_codon:yes gene_type:complete
MAATTNLEIVTPSMVIVSEPAEMVVIPGADGDIGALPRHSNLMSTLHRGVIDIYNENKITSKVMIDGGIAEINEDSIIILAERAEKLEKSNKQVFQDKLLQFKTETNNIDKNIADQASKNASFMQAVIDNIS